MIENINCYGCKSAKTKKCKTCRYQNYHAIYTYERWQQDGSFKADEMQEVDKKTYFEMLNVMPPTYMKNKEGEPFSGCFLMGEPADHKEDSEGVVKPRYHGFCKYNGKYYHIGLLFEDDINQKFVATEE